jgi:hypothetical protein
MSIHAQGTDCEHVTRFFVLTFHHAKDEFTLKSTSKAKMTRRGYEQT